MPNSLKTIARDLLPKRHQVPAKYWYGWLRGALEEEMKLLGLLVRNHDRVIDVGGNRGIYTYRLWRLGATVEVFEPNPTCYRVLEAWAAGKPRVRVHSVALSNHAGSASLHIPIDEFGVEHDASASIENSGFAHARDQLVSTQTLDNYQFRAVSLIKIDVEGHEYNVIEGASETIRVMKPALLIEIEQRHINRPILSVFEKISSFGYNGYFLDAGRLTNLRNFDLMRDQNLRNIVNVGQRYINNFIFLHQHRSDNMEIADQRSPRLFNITRIAP